MAWFKKNTQKKQFDAAFQVLSNLFKTTTENGTNPIVIRFDHSGSLFRYLVFCLSTVQTACANKMTNPDAVLNELLRRIVNDSITNTQFFFGDSMEPQDAANQASMYLQKYIHEWSEYIDIKGINATAGTNTICLMLQNTEIDTKGNEADELRLWPLASWIEDSLHPMREAFSQLSI